MKIYLRIALVLCLLGVTVLAAVPGLHTRKHHAAQASDHGDDDCVVCRYLGHFTIDQPPVTAIARVQVLYPLSIPLYQESFLIVSRNTSIPRAPPVLF